MERSAFSKFALLILAASVVGACGGNQSSNQLLPSTNPIPDDGGEGGGVSHQAFYVKAITGVDRPAVTYLHKFNDFNSPCEVAAGSTGNDLKCILNIREHDLYFWGVELEINVPGETCKFFHHNPYFYYNFETGYGPEKISLAYNKDTATISSCSFTAEGSVTAGVVNDGTCYFPTPAWGDAEAWVTPGNAPKCVYDRSSVEGLPNCCFGGYQYIYSETETVDGVPKTTMTESKGDWGGSSWAECLAGPPIDSTAWPKTKNGWPMTRIHQTTYGYKERFPIKGPLSVYAGSFSVFAANMYDWAGYSTSNHSTTLPKAMDPGTDRSGSGLLSPNPAYEYLCLDESHEVKNRIRLYINEWDTNEEFAEYVTTSGASGSPDVPVGNDGTDCDSGGSVGSRCNDKVDWDDIDLRMTFDYPEELKPF